METNQVKKTKSFDNLRTLSLINNNELSRMNESVKKMRAAVENISRSIRDVIKSKEEVITAPKSAVIDDVSSKKVVVNVKPAQKPADFQRKDQNQRSFKQNDFKANNNAKQNIQNKFNKPQQNTKPSFVKEKPGQLERAEDVFAAPQRRVFDNKRKNERDHGRDYDDNREIKNRKSMARRGLMEEDEITARIRSNRKIKTKKEKEEPVVVATAITHAVISTETITVKQLSEKIGKTVAEILKQLMVLGIMSNVNSTIDFTTAELVASELGVVLEQKLEKSYEEQLNDEFVDVEDEEDASKLKGRPPIVTILGHVDHGKTTLLDYIRKTHIASGEAGGITQHISAYQIETMNRQITFIDTPGHAAFSAMRARGASVTDVAILVVAADDGVKQQTIEAIQDIKEAKVPMIVAINKIDKPTANIDRVKEELAKYDVMPEEWGGDTIFVPISALKGQGVEQLLEMILLVADMKELKANYDKNALGMVIEGKLDKGKGPIATVIILNGTLKVGDTVISGMHMGKVRAILDDKQKRIKVATPSKPVSILGLDGVPNAGDKLYAVDDKMSKKVLEERRRKMQSDLINAKTTLSTEEFLAKNAKDEKKILYVIVKTDVQGSFEALTGMLNKIENEEIRVECIHGGVGAITENDVLLAKSANAKLVAFNIKPDIKAQELAEQNHIEIIKSSIIYEITDKITKIAKDMRTPIFEERVIGHCEAIRIFKISRIGTVAGCVVKDGKITKNAKIRLLRDGKKLVETTITTLQREKQDVKEVSQNMECGIKMEGWNDIILGDIIEAFVMEQVIRD